MMMTPLPSYNEQKKNAMVLYFDTEGASPQDVERRVTAAYACYSAVGVVKKDGKTFVALEIDGVDEDL